MTNDGGSPARRPRVNELFSSVSALLPALAAGSFVLSAAYDIGYFVRLGVNPGVIPTTLSDHTRSALLWLPLVGVTLLWFGLVDIFRFPADSWNEWFASHSSPRPRHVILILLAPLGAIALIWMLLSGNLPLALVTYPITASFLLVLMTWIQLFFAPVVIWHYWPSRRSSQPVTTSAKLFAISGWVVFVPILGYLVALAETQISVLHKHPWVIERFTVRAFVKGQEPEVVFKVLRSFEKGVLVQEIDTPQIRFFQWAEVLSLQYPN